jgi:predicted ATPase/DNA-binding CsgD family transcriptional regulator
MQIPLSPLTDREQNILGMLAQGLSDKEIAEAAFLTVGTVKWYNRQIYSKLDVTNRTEAVTRAQQLRLLGDESYTPAPPLQSDSRPHLPAQITSFVGRSTELNALKTLLNTARLVTLTGPPGAGKTRLALEVASAVMDNYRDGVYFIPLASTAAPDLTLQSIAQMLDVKESGRDSLSNELKRHLREKKRLLVLDNFEHLLSAAPLVSELLTAAPYLTVLVTSRAPLRLYGEQEFPVPPLQLPDLKQEISIQSIKSYEAVDLFVQRAKATSPTFTLENNAVAIASICVHLDGLPLAIELAAARIKFYPPQTLLIRLGNRLEALSDGPRDFPSRQRTLRATLAWSYDLLSPEEQILFARLGVFAGGCTLDDVQAVCGGGLNIDTADGMEALINNSLISQVQSPINEPRFMLLETMREYALEKLDESGERAAICERHAQYFLVIAEQTSQEYYGPQMTTWFIRLEAQHDNLRAALRWAIASGNGQMGLRFISGLSHFWRVRGHLSEGRSWLPQVLELKNTDEPTKILADALHGIGDLAYLQSDYDAARALYTEALILYEKLELHQRAAYTLVSLGEVATEVGDYDTAPIMFKKGYALSRQAGDVQGSARALTQLGWSALRTGDFDHAREWLEEGLVLFEATNDRVNIGLTYSGLGEIAVRTGEFEKATILLEKSLNIRRDLSEIWGIAASLGSLAWVAMCQRDYERAAHMLGESLLIRREIGDKGGIAWCLEKFAEIAQLNGDNQRAVRIFGAAAAIRASLSSIVDPSDQPHYHQLIDQLRTKLTGDLFEAVWSEGYAMTLEQIIPQFALTR